MSRVVSIIITLHALTSRAHVTCASVCPPKRSAISDGANQVYGCLARYGGCLALGSPRQRALAWVRSIEQERIQTCPFRTTCHTSEWSRTTKTRRRACRRFRRCIRALTNARALFQRGLSRPVAAVRSGLALDAVHPDVAGNRPGATGRILLDVVIDSPTVVVLPMALGRRRVRAVPRDVVHVRLAANV